MDTISALKRIGSRLASLRNERGLSQSELAEMCGVAQGTISRIESGKSFETSNLLIILEALDKPVGDFFVDAGFTKEMDSYREYTFTISVIGQRIRRISGNVVGPGLRREVK